MRYLPEGGEGTFPATPTKTSGKKEAQGKTHHQAGGLTTQTIPLPDHWTARDALLVYEFLTQIQE